MNVCITIEPQRLACAALVSGIDNIEALPPPQPASATQLAIAVAIFALALLASRYR